MSMENPEVVVEEAMDQSSLGVIKINHSVVASIVRIAASKVPGVVGVSTGFVDGLADFFGKKDTERGVKVAENESSNYQIEIHLIMEFGAELAKTAYQVQLAVSNQVGSMTGKQVDRVDVIIEGVKLPGTGDKKPKSMAETSESEWEKSTGVAS